MSEALAKKRYRLAKRMARMKMNQLPEIIVNRSDWDKNTFWLIPAGTEGKGTDGEINGVRWQLIESHGEDSDAFLKKNWHRVYKL